MQKLLNNQDDSNLFIGKVGDKLEGGMHASCEVYHSTPFLSSDLQLGAAR